MKKAKTINNCCLKNKNTIKIEDGWSYVCKVCGRYTYDYENNQYVLSKKELIEKII